MAQYWRRGNAYGVPIEAESEEEARLLHYEEDVGEKVAWVAELRELGWPTGAFLPRPLPEVNLGCRCGSCGTLQGVDGLDGYGCQTPGCTY
jgi:hypothetical protein